MPLTVIAIVGAANANSFQTVAEIDTYYLARVPATTAAQWTGASSVNKDAAAVMATLWMTNLIVWTGYVTSLTQALPWPRNGMWGRNELQSILTTVIPQEVKNAQAELARLLLLTDRTQERPQDVEGLAGLTVGPIKLSFRDASGRGTPSPVPPIMPDFILDMLVPSWVEYSIEGDSNERSLLRF